AADVAPELELGSVRKKRNRPRVWRFDLERQAKLSHDLGRHPSKIANRWRALLHEEDLLSAPSEQVRRDQRVDARSDDDGVEAHARFPRIAAAALRPEAPMTPPPGCVPEPHCQSPSTGVR